jgi:three-Cys-motif partner protein
LTTDDFASDLASSATPHPDELRVVEDHLQTQHKLDVYRRYLGAYTTIIARARRVPFNNREVWIVDTHGGAGLHRSREDPDGFRYGSPLIACNAARLVQKKFPNFHVHVRAVEKQTPWVVRLQTRIEEFNRASPGSEVVDALVTNGNFADHVIDFIEQAQQANALSLWFIDPFGFKDIPYEALEPLTTPRFGPELIVNLDLSGIWRKAGKPDDIVDIGEVSTDQSDQQKVWGAQSPSRSKSNSQQATEQRKRRTGYDLRPS